MPIKFSLVMGTVGRTDEVTRFLTSLSTQPQAGECELIVVDQNTDDRLEPVLSPFRSMLDIQHLRSPPGLSRARNVGLQHIRGDIVAFPDDDCWYPPGLLTRVLETFAQHPEVDVVTGRFTNEQGQTEGRWLTHAQTLTPYSVWRGAISFSIFLKRPVVDRLDGFDERLGVGAGTPWGAGEETDYLLRTMRSGAQVRYDPDLCLGHPTKTASFDAAAVARHCRYESGFGYVMRKNRFPSWYLPATMARTFCGTLIALASLNRPKAAFKWASLWSRAQGWRQAGQVPPPQDARPASQT